MSEGMASRFDALPQRRAIIDRRDVADALANLPDAGGVSGMRNAATPIGTSCRICPRPDCDQRAFPPAASIIEIDPDARGAVPYSFR